MIKDPTPTAPDIAEVEPGDDEIRAARDRYAASVFALAQAPLHIGHVDDIRYFKTPPVSVDGSEDDEDALAEADAKSAPPRYYSDCANQECHRRGVCSREPCLRTAKTEPCLSPGSTWTGPDGTVYDVVRPEEIGGGAGWPVVDGARTEFALVPRDSLRASLRSLLGLDPGADDEAVMGAVRRALDLVADYNGLSNRVVTVADEAFGPFPVQTADEALTAIERGAFEARRALVVRELADKRGVVLENMERERRALGDQLAQAQAATEAARARNAQLFAQLEETRSKLAAADRACEASRRRVEEADRKSATLENERDEERERLNDLAKDLGVSATGTAFDVIVRVQRAAIDAKKQCDKNATMCQRLRKQIAEFEAGTKPKAKPKRATKPRRKR